MSQLSERLLVKYYKDSPHPYRLFEQSVDGALGRGADKTLLDAGCGRSVPVLRKFLGRARRLVGVELVDFTDVPPGIETLQSDLAHIALPSGSVDVIMSRSVFEHLTDPDSVYAELSRLLKPGGRLIFLTANMWDYATLIARAVPNRFHAGIVRRVEGRDEEDTFPTAYRTNTRSAVERLAQGSGLRIREFAYLNQYPNYLMFNGLLFLLGTAYERVTSRFDSLRTLRGWILVTLEKP